MSVGANDRDGLKHHSIPVSSGGSWSPDVDVMTEPTETPDRSFESNPTVCPFCGVGCTIEYAGRGSATGVEGPVNARGEICPKGAAAFDVVDHKDGPTEPLVRHNGSFVTAPWEEALDRVASGIGRVVDEHGPDAVQFFASSNCTNEEN